MEVKLVNEHGNEVKCIKCKVNTPKNIQFGILCRGCMKAENTKWQVFRMMGGEVK